MTTGAPQDGGSNPDKLKEKLKHPFQNMREKFRDSSLYDLKVGLINKK
jgi:phospholipase D1/2